MPRTLLSTTCVLNPNSSYAQYDTFYDPALRAAQTSPISSTTTPQTITCNAFQIAPDILLDNYCAIDSTNAAIRRKVYSAAGGSGSVQFYRYADSVDGACNGACDLAITYELASSTSSTAAQDGTIVLEANTTKPSITAFLAGVGSPTTTTIFNPTSGPGQARVYQFVYKNLKAGNYVVQLQDNSNCQLSTNVLTVNAGAAPGTTGLPTNITWFKFEYVDPAPSFGGNIVQGLIQGYAWDKTAKQGITIAPIRLNFPIFYEFSPNI